MRAKTVASSDREVCSKDRPDRRDFYLGFLSSTCITMFVIIWKAGLIF